MLRKLRKLSGWTVCITSDAPKPTLMIGWVLIRDAVDQLKLQSCRCQLLLNKYSRALVETSKLEVNLVDVQAITILVNGLMKTGLELGTDVIVGILSLYLLQSEENQTLTSRIIIKVRKCRSMMQVMNTGRNRLKPKKAQFLTQMVILNLNLKKKSMTFFADHHTVVLLLLLHL